MSPVPPAPPTRGEISRLAHEMSNSLAYVTTNLSVLAEEIEGSDRLEALVGDALEGAERLGDLVRELRTSGWAAETPTPSARVTAARILVVDDEPAILNAVKRALRVHDVTVASSAREAAPLLEKSAFDVVLCDLVMPEQSGIDWFASVQKTTPGLAERFVFMTGGGFNDRTRSFLNETVHPVLQKPFDAKTLRWVIASRLAERT